MPDDERLNLEIERLGIESHWRGPSEYVAMSVAAGMTFHQVHGNTNAIVTRTDYDDALSIAATALSRLIAVYTAGSRQEKVKIEVDLVRQRFRRGATQLRSLDGGVVENLSVKRSEMVSAISLIKRAGLPFSFAVLAPQLPASDKSPALPSRKKD